MLPNHYHLLVDSLDILALLEMHGHLHGRTSFRWNGEDARRGRQVWHRTAETAMKSERHFWASLNYVLHNAVRHGYVKRWQDWPYGNAAEYLEDVGRDLAETAVSRVPDPAIRHSLGPTRTLVVGVEFESRLQPVRNRIGKVEFLRLEPAEAGLRIRRHPVRFQVHFGTRERLPVSFWFVRDPCAGGNERWRTARANSDDHPVTI